MWHISIARMYSHLAHSSDMHATRVLHFRISDKCVGQVQKESNIKAVL